MTLIPWNKKRGSDGGDIIESPLAQFRGEMHSLFDRFFRDPFAGFEGDGPPGAFRGFPRTDLAESENDVTLTMELPGIDPKNVEVDVTGGLLTVRGEKKCEHEEQRSNYHFVERQYGTFHRAVQLPASADADKVSAVFKDGVLSVTIAKQPGAKPKRIAVKAE